MALANVHNTLQVAHETLLLIRQTSLASSLLSSDSCDSLPASGTRTRHRSHRKFIHLARYKQWSFVFLILFMLCRRMMR